MKLNTYAVVKHNINTNKYPTEYLFRVRRGTKIAQGDIVICDTMKGLSAGSVAKVFKMSENSEREVVKMYNAYAPLKEIVFVLPLKYYELITQSLNSTLAAVKECVHNTKCMLDGVETYNGGLPF